MDNLTRKQRSYWMSRVRSRDTKLEKTVRSALHRRGYRFRKHVRDLHGTPDVVFTRWKVVVFIDGDFWNGYRFDEWRGKLSDFWQDKIFAVRYVALGRVDRWRLWQRDSAATPHGK